MKRRSFLTSVGLGSLAALFTRKATAEPVPDVEAIKAAERAANPMVTITTPAIGRLSADDARRIRESLAQAPLTRR